MARRPKRQYRRRGGRRSMANYIGGRISVDLSMTNTAPVTGVLIAIGDNVEEKTRVTSVKATYTIRNYTPVAGAGPVILFLAHSDYTLAEIEAFIEATGSWNAADLVTKEISQRRIREVGTFDQMPVSATGVQTINDGKSVRTRLNWMLFEGQTVNLLAYNAGTAAFATTTAIVHANGKANLWTL